MPFVPALNTVEVFMEHEYNGKEGLGWVLHYRGALGPWSLTTMEDLSDTLKAWWIAEIKPLVVPGCILTRVRMRDITTANGLIYDSTSGLPQVGTRTGNPTPANVSFSLKKNTGLAGKSFRGRVYLMGLSETDVNANFLDPVPANNFVDAFNEAIIFVAAEDTYAMALVSKFSGNAPRPSGLVTNVTSFSYSDLRIDTRRDRL